MSLVRKQHMGKEIEIPSPYIPCNNSQQKKNLTAKPEIEHGISWEGNNVTTEPSGYSIIAKRNKEID